MINRIGTKQIETGRVILRKYISTDAHDMYENWCADSEVCKFYTWSPHKNIEETESILTAWISQYENPLVFHWIIIDKNTNRAIGAAYLNSINEDEKSAVVNCMLSRLVWGKGYAAEITKAIIDFAFNEAGFTLIKSHHHEDNIQSSKALLKSGMAYVGSKHVEYPECPRINGNYSFYLIRNEFSKS